MQHIFAVFLLLLTACAPSAAPSPTPQVVSIFATAAAQPWLSEAYTCAQGLQIVLTDANDPNLADISLRIGEPETTPPYTYEIGSDDLMIVTNRESPVQNLTLEQARALFTNPGQTGAQIWVYASGEDIQQIFSDKVMQTVNVSSLSRLAASPQQMSDILNNDKNAVGFLPRRWKAGTVRDVFTLSPVPVLALVKSEPRDAVKQLLACLQK